MKFKYLYIGIVFALIGLSCDHNSGPIKSPEEIYNHAISLFNEKAFKQAVPLFEEAIKLFENKSDIQNLLKAKTYLFKTYVELNKFRLAISTSENISVLLKKTGDVHGDIQMNIMQGELYEMLQLYTRAFNKYQTAYSSAIAFDNKEKIIDAKLKMANLYLLQNNNDNALQDYKFVLTRSEEVEDNKNIAISLLNIGRIYIKNLQYAEALSMLNKGLSKINSSSEPIIYAEIKAEIGKINSFKNVNEALRDYRDAINALRLARLGKELEAVLLFYVAQLYENNLKSEEAQRYYLQSQEITKSLGDKISENYLAVFIAKNIFNSRKKENYPESLKNLKNAYEVIAKNFAEYGHITGEGFAYIQLAKISEQNGEITKAYNFYSKAVALDKNNIAEYFNIKNHSPYIIALQSSIEKTSWHEQLSSFLIKQLNYEEAINVIELMRLKKISKIFNDIEASIRNPNLRMQSKVVREELFKAKIMELELSAYLANKEKYYDEQEIEDLKSDIEKLKIGITKNSAQIINEYPNYETLVNPSVTNISEIKKYIPEGSVAVEFVPSDNLIHIVAITNSKIVVRNTDLSKEKIYDLIFEYKKLLHNPSVYSGEASQANIELMTRFAILSTQIYDALLRPIDDLIDKNLIIITNDMFEGFPFHAIERNDGKGGVKYLIEITGVDYLPSLSAIRYKGNPFIRAQEVVAFGNPTGKNWSIDYELRDIRSFFKNAKVLVGIEASLDNLNSIKADILQISTEFIPPNVAMPLGGITLSNGLIANQSNVVVFEKMMELKASPVVILTNQYGYNINLTTKHAMLLQINGTPDIILNVWSADRKAAKFFSEFFFTHLANGLAPGDAYRQALINLIKKREVNQPHSWGQFFHYGIG